MAGKVDDTGNNRLWAIQLVTAAAPEPELAATGASTEVALGLTAGLLLAGLALLVAATRRRATGDQFAR